MWWRSQLPPPPAGEGRGGGSRAQGRGTAFLRAASPIPTFPRRRGKEIGLALVLLFALSGCGFKPLYSRGTEAADERLATIRVNPISDRLGQRLAIDLRDTFNPLGRKVDATHTLNVSLVTERREVALRRDGTASRVELVVNANYTLSELGTQKSVLY